MKKGWEVKKLSDIGFIFNGNTISENVKKEKYLNHKEGLPYIATKDVGYDTVIDYDNGVKIPFAEIESFKVAPRNTVFICAEGGSAGRKIGITNQDVCFGNKLFAISTNNNVESKYVFYWYFSSEFQKQFKSNLAGLIGGVSVNKFREITIPIPPLPEQQRIVSVLDEAFASIAQAKSNAERNLVNARELFDAVLQSIVSNDEWEKKTLKEISITFGRGKSKNRPRGDPKLYGGKYPFIQTGDISSSNHWITTYSQTYNELGLAQSKLWKRGTICIAIVGANVGETAILDFDACFPDSVIGIVVNDKTTSNEYVEYLLQTFKTAFKVMGKGTARDNINMGMFENLKFPFPPLAEQRAIVGRLEALSAETGRLEEIYEQKVESLEELKKSVLGKAFEGEL